MQLYDDGKKKLTRKDTPDVSHDATQKYRKLSAKADAKRDVYSYFVGVFCS